MTGNKFWKDNYDMCTNFILWRLIIPIITLSLFLFASDHYIFQNISMVIIIIIAMIQQ